MGTIEGRPAGANAQFGFLAAKFVVQGFSLACVSRIGSLNSREFRTSAKRGVRARFSPSG